MATFRENFVNFFRGRRDEYETPPPPQARPDIRAPRQVDTSATGRYRVEEGRITQERPGRLDTSGVTEPRENLLDRFKSAETSEYLEAVRRGVTEIRDKEQEVLENRYGRGIMGAFRGLNQWLHETDLGRTVKISGKIIGGVTMAACAGFLAGTPGIAFSPALALLGKKYAITGAIEAFQYFGGMRTNPETGRREIGGRERLRRLDIEAGRQRRAGLENLAQNAATEHAAGRLSAEEYRTVILDVVRDIQQNEESILRNDREYEDVRKSNQRVRGLVGTAATLGLGILNGIPFGIQDLDKDGIFHSVRGAWNGIRWIQGDAMETASNWLSHFGNTRELVAGVGQGAEIAGTMDQFWQLSGGLGVAAAGLAASTFREFGTFAQGSRARINELLSENVRIEDGVIPRGYQQYGRPIGPGRPTTNINRVPTTTINNGPATPTTTINRAPTTTITRATTTINRGPASPTTTINRAPTTAIGRGPVTPTTTINRGPATPTTAIGVSPTERAQPTSSIAERATTAAAERGGRFVPLEGEEIQKMSGAARELRTELLNRMGVENVPQNAKQDQFTATFGEWLAGASSENVERARIFMEDSLRDYGRLNPRENDPRRVAMRGALDQIAAHVRERAAAGANAPDRRATTTKNPERPTTSNAERSGQLGALRGNLKIENFFENGNALFKKDLLRTLQGVGPEAAIDASPMAVDQWLGSLDTKQLKRLDSYLARQQKAAENNKDSYGGEDGSEKTYKKNLQSLQNLRDRISALEQMNRAA